MSDTGLIFLLGNFAGILGLRAMQSLKGWRAAAVCLAICWAFRFLAEHL
jgi:hypothetical protein